MMDYLKVMKLIRKLFAGNLKPAERILLSEEEPMKNFLLQQWEQKSDTHLKDKVDSSEIWSQIIRSCPEENKRVEHRSGKFRLYSLSAAVIALLLLSVWSTNYLFYSYTEVTAPVNQKMALTLPDSSKVWLNAGSTLRYWKRFRTDRKVQLTGEAFFDVEKMPAHPFRVYFNDACVEVKGTEFNIKSEVASARVTLYSGRIDFQPEGRNSIHMNPKECVIYTVAGQKIEQKTINSEYDWRNEEFRFIDKPMNELIQFINSQYKVHLQIKDPQCATYLFSGNIAKTERLPDVLEKICLTMGMNFKQEKDTIILY